MNKNEQIQEMAKTIYELELLPELWLCDADTIAKELYSKGYRKASEVAREIFEEITKMFIDEHIESFKALDDTWIHKFRESLFVKVNELKKKYTEE